MDWHSIGRFLMVTPPISESLNGASNFSLILGAQIVSLSTNATIVPFASRIPSAKAGLFQGFEVILT